MAQAEPYVIVVERPRRRRWRWVLGIGATLSVVCCVAAILVWSPIGKEYPAYLELTDPVVGLVRYQNPEVSQAASDLQNQMYRDYDADDAMAAILTDPAVDGKHLILVGATKLILDPGKELDNAINATARRTVRTTAYPQLGEHLKCGKTEDDKKQPITICGWADHGSLGVGIFYGPWQMDTCARSLRDIRDAVVRRGERSTSA